MTDPLEPLKPIGRAASSWPGEISSSVLLPMIDDVAKTLNNAITHIQALEAEMEMLKGHKHYHKNGAYSSDKTSLPIKRRDT